MVLTLTATQQGMVQLLLGLPPFPNNTWASDEISC